MFARSLALFAGWWFVFFQSTWDRAFHPRGVLERRSRMEFFVSPDAVDRAEAYRLYVFPSASPPKAIPTPSSAPDFGEPLSHLPDTLISSFIQTHTHIHQCHCGTPAWGASLWPVKVSSLGLVSQCWHFKHKPPPSWRLLGCWPRFDLTSIESTWLTNLNGFSWEVNDVYAIVGGDSNKNCTENQFLRRQRTHSSNCLFWKYLNHSKQIMLFAVLFRKYFLWRQNGLHMIT